MALKEILNSGFPPDDPDYWVVEEGLCGRTSCREDPVGGDRNGLRQIMPVLESHQPVDIAVVMLGTNDLKVRFCPTPYDIAKGVYQVVKVIQNSRLGPNQLSPKVVMICPPAILDTPVFAPMFGSSMAMSEKLAPYFLQFAQECGAVFLDAGGIIKSSDADGIHLDSIEHHKLALVVAEIIKKIAMEV
jgi:lysophospholipase L1-like esterase